MTVIINELLCYMLCKIDSVPIDVLVKLVGENFSDDEVETAKGLLCDHVDESIRVGKRRGQEKKKMNLEGIAKMIIECDRHQLPKFVALDLAKLPPITVDCIDVSALMRKQQLMDIEMSTMKDVINDILKVTADTSKRVEVAIASKPQSDIGPHSQASSASSVSTSSPQTTKLTYADVVQDGSACPRESEWVTANRAKRGKPPAPRSTTAASGAPALGSAVPAGEKAPPQTAKPSAVIGVKKSGTIRAVATVKRFSMFMSRLPPGTGEDAVRSYVREQSGAETVTVEKLSTRFDSYESYRLDVINPPAEVNLLDPQLWAEGLIVRRFFQKRHTVGPTSGGSVHGPSGR